MFILTKKGFPRFVFQSTNTDHRACSGEKHNKPKRKRKNKEERNANNGSLTKRGDPPPLRPPDSTHHILRLRSAAYQAAPPRRDATPTTLLPGRVLGFPPARGREWGMDTSDTLQEGMVAPAGVTASEPEEPTRDFSRTPNPTAQPGRSQPATSLPTSMRHRSLDATHAASLRSPPRDQEDGERRTRRQEQQHRSHAGGDYLHCRRAGGPSLRHRRGRRPDAAAGHTRPPWPG